LEMEAQATRKVLFAFATLSNILPEGGFGV